jgi:hypothetical protein
MELQQQGQTQTGQSVVCSESSSSNNSATESTGPADVAIAAPTQDLSASSDNLSHQSGPSAKRRLAEKIWNQRELVMEVDDTITTYLNCRPNAGEINDALLFWRNHAAEFELLLPVARCYLSLSASSVLMEAMFSITGLILNSKHAALNLAKQKTA